MNKVDIHDIVERLNAIREEDNPEDVIRMDVPLFIRIMEYAREDANTDMDLHGVAERAIQLSASGQVLDMSAYSDLIPSTEVAVVDEQAEAITEAQFDEAAGEKDACYRKVKSRYKVWPSAYASGALTKCRKVGAANWGKSKKK